MVASPDVSKTPNPGGPVPIPYPNSSFTNTRSTEKVKVVNTAGKILRSKHNQPNRNKVNISSATIGRYLGNIPLLTYVVNKAKEKGYKLVVARRSGKEMLFVTNEEKLQNRTKAPYFAAPLSDSTNANSAVLRKAAFFLKDIPQLRDPKLEPFTSRSIK